MPDRPTRHFSDEEASRIWRRAAELQASRRLPALRPDEQPREDASGAVEPRGMSGEEVEEIAREAGIEAEFVRHAMAEAALGASSPDAAAEGMRALRRIRAPVEVVQAELQRVGAEDRYKLRLRDIRSEGDGRELVFDLDGPESMAGGAFRAGDFGAGRHVVGVRAVLLPAADAPEETEMLLYGAPNPQLRELRSYHDIGFGVFGGVLGGTTIGAAGAHLLALTGATLLAPVGVGAVAVGALGIGLVRTLDRAARHKDASAFAQLADEVEGAVRLRALGALPLPPRPPSGG